MQDIEAIASDLRRRANLTRPTYRTRDIIAACFPGVIVTGRTLPIGIEEMVSRTERGTVIVYRRDLPIPDQRYAIAHAIGHLVFDFDGGELAVGDDREVRADRFAAELLVPLAEIEPMVALGPIENSVDGDLFQDAVDQLASDFGVPSWVIERRIRDLTF